MVDILIVAPHPDDEVLGCGGSIARWASAGHAVHVVVLSRGIPELFPDEFIAAGRAELAAAGEVLGVASVTYLDFPAPKLDTVPIYQLASKIRDIVVRLKPQTVCCPHQADLHGDHQAAFWASLVATRPNGGYHVPRVLCYETPSETEWASPFAGQEFVPTVFIDISAYLQKKLDAAACYKSQMKDFPQSRSIRAVESLARWRGATVGLNAAEAFALVREVS
jgi:LmbE family N-acetylglucosaminyl deacetylase